MKIWEKLGGKQTGRAEADAWDTLSADNRLEEERKQQNDERQQTKLIEAMLTGDARALMGEATVRPGRREQYLEMVAEGRIGQEQERWLLGAIRDPIGQNGPEVIFNTKIVGDKHQMRILGAMTSAGFGGYERTSAQSVRELIEKYPLPMDFEGVSAALLDDVRRNNSLEKYTQYQEAMAQFKKTIYGKRQEYWEQMKALDAEAAERGDGRLERLSAGEQKEILKKAEVDGDAWEQGGQKYNLTAEILASQDLAPEYRVKLEGAEVNLSKIYKVGTRQAVVGYVRTDEGVKVRSYYRSNSQGVWRYLPDYVGFPDGQVNYYGKGIDEESVTLPAEVQQALAQIEAEKDGNIQITKTVPDFLLCGTAKRYGSRGDLYAAIHGGRGRGDYYQEVSPTPKVILSSEQRRDYKVPPEQLDVRGGQAPDFTRRLGEWRTKTALYGPTESELYRSYDGTLNYVMNQNDKGQAWVGGVQATGRVTSTGLRKDWVMAGDICTTPYDYEVQSAGYGDTDDRSAVNSHYVNMWNKYLARVPLIQRYLRSK